MDWWRRKLIIFSGFIEALILSGCLFGWPSLLLVLQEEGIYSNVCPTDMLRQESDNKIYSYDNSFGVGQYDTTVLPGENLLRSTTSDLEEASVSPEHFSESHDIVHLNGQTNQNVNDAQNCKDNGDAANCTRNLNATTNNKVLSSREGCDEQRVHMTLIYTFAAVAYGITAIFIGMSLELLGLRVTRLIGSSLATMGFFLLAFATPENSYFLWPALNLIALGTNQLRLSGFQFADLWPEYRATILTCYSSAYSISTTFFLVIQLLYEQNVPMRLMFLCCGGICALTYIPTFFMPKMRIHADDADSEHGKEVSKSKEPLASTDEVSASYVIKVDCPDEDYKADQSDDLSLPQLQVKSEDDNQNQASPNPEKFAEILNGQFAIPERKRKYSFTESLWSLSGMLHMYWHFINLFLILFYSSTFNIWASKVTSEIDQVSFYIKMSGVCCLIAPLFVPVIGIVTDKMIHRAEMRPNRVERLAYTMQAPTYAMAGATTLLSLVMICKLFLNETAIYISLVLIALTRPAVVGSCTSYIRLRFPAEHFNILNGIFTTVISILCFVQYPIMKWMTVSPESYEYAHWLLLVVLIGSLSSPVHMMFRKNIIRYAEIRLGEWHGQLDNKD